MEVNMGKGGKVHEDVIEHLKLAYPGGTTDKKISVFSEKIGYQKSQPDYFTKDGAIVEVVWTEYHHPIFGKIVAYLNYIDIHPDEAKEIWIVSNCKEKMNCESKKKNDDVLNSWRNMYKDFEKMCKHVIKTEYHDKIKFFDYDETAKEKLIKL
jgi:hypothetical protein